MAVGVATAGRSSSDGERHSKRYSGECVAKVLDRAAKEGHGARYPHDRSLRRGGDTKEANEIHRCAQAVSRGGRSSSTGSAES